MEEKGGKGVKGLNGSLIEMGEALPAVFSFPGGEVFPGRCPFELLANAVTELCGGSFGKCDGG